jgi:hypothetical protein
MSKNNKANAFYYFMLDFKNQEEKKGRKFANGLKDVQNDNLCNEIWKVNMQQNIFYLYKKVFFFIIQKIF